eukprot:scpid75449/ scgid35451/ Secretory carrier-associated membrane protein 2
MSGFDRNPFAEPEAANPFADPAVTQYATTKTPAGAGLEEYNPFAGDGEITSGRSSGTTSVTPVVQPPAATAATLETAPAPAVLQPPPPAYQPPPAAQEPLTFPGENSGQTTPLQAATANDTGAQSTPTLSATGTGTAATETTSETVQLSAAQQLELARRDPNFPPLPSCCPVKPCFYHNIQLEIPSRDAKLVRTLFIYWEAVVFTYFYNMIALLVLFADTGDFGSDFGFAVLWFILYSPCSFICWYHCAYRAFKSDSSLRFMIFFVTFFCQCVYNVVQSVGFIGSGGCGLIVALKGKKDAHAVVFFMAIAAFILWVLMSAIGSYMLIRIHRYYRTSGHSMQRVQSEAGSALAQNEGVRSAVISGVKASL